MSVNEKIVAEFGFIEKLQLMITKNMKRIIALGIFLLLPILVQAHPHLFIEYTADLIFDENGLVGVSTEWTFDEMFSWQVIDENTNGDEVVDEKEQQEIYANAFSYLANSEYFANFWEGFERFAVNEVSDFEARIENGQVIYSFYIPWKVAAIEEAKMLKFLFDDESYFCAIVPKKAGVKIVAPETIKTEIIMQDRVTYQISFWQVQ